MLGADGVHVDPSNHFGGGFPNIDHPLDTPCFRRRRQGLRFSVLTFVGIVLLLLLDLAINDTGPISITIRLNSDNSMDTMDGDTGAAYMELEPVFGGFEQWWRMGGADIRWETSCRCVGERLDIWT